MWSCTWIMNLSHLCSLRMLVFWCEFCIKIFWCKNCSLIFSESRNFIPGTPAPQNGEGENSWQELLCFILFTCLCQRCLSGFSQFLSTFCYFWDSTFLGCCHLYTGCPASPRELWSNQPGLDFLILCKDTGDPISGSHSYKHLPTVQSLQPRVLFTTLIWSNSKDSHVESTWNINEWYCPDVLSTLRYLLPTAQHGQFMDGAISDIWGGEQNTGKESMLPECKWGHISMR